MTRPIDRTSYARLLAPRSIVVVGASGSRDWATGNQVIRNLRSAGYTGRLEVLNPAGGEIEQIEAATDFSSIEPVDVAVVAVGAKAVLSVLADAHDAGIPAAVVMSIGLDREALDAIRMFAHETGMLVHGPNCMGVINVEASAMIWADEGILADLPAGNVSLISQSGSGAIFVARSMSGVGFAHVISTGGEAATTTADYLEFLAQDTATDVIGVIIESIADADALAAAVRRVKLAGKSVVAMKVGRSAAGAAATVAHTGALLADDAVTTAFFDRIGLPLVADYDELASSLELLVHLQGRPVGAVRTAVITISGGQAALAADLADARNLPLATFTVQGRQRLERILPGMQVNNPLDAGGSAHAEDDAYPRALDILVDDDGVDVIVAITDSQSTLTAVEIGYEDELVDAVRAAAARSRKPLLIASSSSLTLHPSRIAHPGDPVAVIRGIGNAFAAIKAAAVALEAPIALLDRPSDLPDEAAVEKLRQSLSQWTGPLPSDPLGKLLDVYGLPFVRSSVVASLDAAQAWADGTGYPVVLKTASPDVPHRSDIGAVVVGIADREELADAWEKITEAVESHVPDARFGGMEVQEQVLGGIEAFVGGVNDARIGSTVGIGMGGVLVELLEDVAHAYAPLSRESARDALGRSRLSKLLSGYRNLYPVVDESGLVDLLVRVSWMMDDLGSVVAECDFNPVFVSPDTGRAVLIDALVVARGARR